MDSMNNFQTEIREREKTLAERTSELETAVHALETAQKTVSAMFESNPHMNVLFDSNFKVIDCNPSAYKFMGFDTKEEMLEGFVARLTSYIPEFQSTGRQSISIAERLLAVFSEGYATFETELRIDGLTRIVDMELKRIPYGDSFAVVAYVLDMTEQRERENEIMRRDTLMYIINDAAALLLKSDMESFPTAMEKGMEVVGRCLEVNRVGIWKNIHKSDGRLYYRLVYQWTEGDSASEIRVGTEYSYDDALPNWGSILSGGESVNGPLKDFSDEETAHLAAHAIQSVLDIPIFMDDEFWGFAAFEDCLNERLFTEGEVNILRSWGLIAVGSMRRYEISLDLEAATKTAEEANRAKSAFLANMSHEIRTPMNSIMGFAELALDQAVTPQIKDYLGKITDSTKWLLRIINDILDISKIESGKMELEKIPFNLHSIFTRCQSVILPSVNEKGLDLRVYAEPTIGKKLLGDPVRLYQALMNLLSNAVKFTSAGTVKLSSSILRSDENTATVYFEVQDCGIGMTQEQMAKVFDPFIQADSSTTRNYGGTGLGLTITKNIVVLMGGMLCLDSTPGTGTTFSFALTFETVESTDEKPEYDEIGTLEKPHFDALVLICEDNPLNQQVICDHLSRVGIRSIIAENGKIGVEMVEERIRNGLKPYDLIFTDIFMPVMDGIETASRINALGTGTPIVAMTANVMTNELEKYKKNGMTDYVSKPFTSQQLWRCLLKYLKPVGMDTINEADHERDNLDLHKKLRSKFVRDNQTKFEEIIDAIDAENMQLAHRLAHTLKTNAGMIGEKELQTAAAEMESLLNAGSIPNTSQISALKSELSSVLEELSQYVNENPVAAADDIDKTSSQTALSDQLTPEVLALFDKLEHMLDNINPECVNLLDEISLFPGTAELIRRIDDYDFEAASRALIELRKGWVT